MLSAPHTCNMGLCETPDKILLYLFLVRPLNNQKLSGWTLMEGDLTPNVTLLTQGS